MKLKIIFLVFAVYVNVSYGYIINENAMISDSDDQMTFQDITSTTDFRNVCSELQPGYHIPSYGGYIHLSSIANVEIVNSTIQNIPSNLFEKFSGITNFAASDVNLEDINRKDFESAKNLEFLNLPKNKIAKVDIMIFLHCYYLKIIDLSRNEIRWIHDTAFEIEDTKLEKIDLSFNKLTTIKEESFNFASSINFESNEIAQIVKSIEPSNKMLKMEKLNLSNNKLKQFEFPDALINILCLANNEIESFNISGVVELDLRNNSLQELFVKNGTKEINVEHNKISKLKCEVNSELQIVRLSANKLGNDVLLALKNAKNIKTLELSDNQLTELSLESLGNFKEIEELRLDKNGLNSIDLGFFSHQNDLRTLNISHNTFTNINFHVFSSLDSLQSLDISGNNLSIIKEFQNLKQILPNLTSIGLEGNDWSCEYLSKLKISFNVQRIKFIRAVNPEEKEANVSGIKCSADSTKVVEMIDDKDNKVAEKMNQIIEQLYQLKSQVNTIESSKTDVKSLIVGIQKEILNIKSENMKGQLSTVNATNINEVRSIVEQINNMTLEKQKLANDQLIHTINEQKLENAKNKMENEKILIAMKSELSLIKSESSHISPIQTTQLENRSGLTSLEIVLIVALFTFLALFFVSASNKIKNFFASFNQLPRHRPSRCNSNNTVITFDNSSEK